MFKDTVRFRCSANVAARVIDEEAIMIHLESGRYYSSEGLGAILWHLLDSGLPFGAIVTRLTEHFTLPPDRAREDLDRFVSDLVHEELLVTEPRAADADAPSAGLHFGITPYTAPTLHPYRDMADLLALDPPMPALKPMK